MIDIPNIFKNFGQVKAGQSTRMGGVSPQPYSSLNLGLSVGDAPEHVAKNRTLFFDLLGLNPNQVSFSHQIHEAEILVASQPGATSGYDAQITNQKNVGLAVSVADCCPILIYDAQNQAIAAIHAGWRGTVKQIVSKTLEQMQQHYGSVGAHCHAYVGTCISTEAFEVSDDVAENFAENQKIMNTKTGKFHVNLKQANTDQLVQFGIPISQIEISPNCSFLNNDKYFSHRKEQGKTGRMMAAIVLK